MDGRTKKLAYELIAFILLPVAFYYLLDLWTSAHAGYLNVLKGHRTAVYPAAVGLLGSLLGFTIASLTIVIGYTNNPRLDTVRASKHWPSLFESFTRTIRWLAATTAVAVAALFFDRDDGPNAFLGGGLIVTLLLTAAFLARMFWVLERIVQLMIAPGNRAPGA